MKKPRHPKKSAKKAMEARADRKAHKTRGTALLTMEDGNA